LADNKKYYYLRLVDNFYDRDEMIMLESMPDGYMYSNILLKLYLRSLKNEGKLLFNDRIPYNSTMLANITRFPVGVIEKALKIFLELGLIEILDNGAIYMLDIQDFIGKSTTEADRKRNYRKRIEDEKLKLGQMSGQISDKSTPEIETEIETKTEIDLETKTELKTELEQQQDIERKDVVGLVSMYFPYLNEKDLNTIVNEFLKTNKDLYYLSEKLILTTDAKNIENKVGYLLKAIKEDYQMRYVTSLENLVAVWEQELLEKPNNPIIADKVKYYRFKCGKKN
jgi:predicted phage replisome organizer